MGNDLRVGAKAGLLYGMALAVSVESGYGSLKHSSSIPLECSVPPC